MHDALRLVVAADQAVEMHEARHIESGDDLGAGFSVVLNAVAAHEARGALLCHGKGAAETAALIRPRQLDDFDAPQLREKLAHLIKWSDHLFGRACKPELTQTMATHLETDFERKLAIHGDDFRHVRQIFTELK